MDEFILLLKTVLLETKENYDTRCYACMDAAKAIVTYCPREDVPDWVAILAGGDPDHMDDVVQVALADMQDKEE